MIAADRWQTAAACVDTPTAVYFPTAGAGGYDTARRICAGCPVSDQCLEEALVEEAELGNGARHGMRAGLTPQDRDDLVALRRALDA